MNIYYVYQLIDPQNGKPFYIGKGTGNRAYSHVNFKDGNNNPHKDRVIRKILSKGLQPKVEILFDNITEEDHAYELETQLIESIGLDNLTNICADRNPPRLTGSQNGFYGKTHTEENRVRMGDANRGKDTKTQAGKESISASLKQRWEEDRQEFISMLESRKGEKRSAQAIESYKQGAQKRNAAMSPEDRRQRSLKGAETKKKKYANMRRQAYVDQDGNKRFRYVTKTPDTVGG